MVKYKLAACFSLRDYGFTIGEFSVLFLGCHQSLFILVRFSSSDSLAESSEQISFLFIFDRQTYKQTKHHQYDTY